MKRGIAWLALWVLLVGMLFTAAAEGITYTGTVTGGSLHLRREPNSSAKVISTYKSGTKVEILENDGTWCKVTVGSNTGYMMAKYLKIEANYSHLGWGKTPDDGTVLNIRTGAGETFPVVMKFMSGCSFEVSEDAGDWYKVRIGSEFGYVEKARVTLFEGEYALGFSLEDAASALKTADLENAPQEYGNLKTLVRTQGELHYSLAYPETGVEAADNVLSSWVQGTLRTFQADQMQNHPGEMADCTVNFQSVSLDARYHSVVLMAEYRVAGLTVETALAVNIDSQAGEVLDNAALFSGNEAHALFCLECAAGDLLAKPTDGYSGVPDASWLRYAALGHDGVQLFLPAGMVLPMGLGTRKVTLKYSQVAESMTLASETLKSYGRVIDPTKPMIALTFDDGPSEFTDRILRVLLQYDARATFCVVGTQIETYPSVLKRTAASGNEIACHTWSHPKLINLSAERIRTQIKNTNDLVRELTGFEVKVLRPPYGKHNANVRKICADMGIVIAHWELDTRDWSTRSTSKTYKAIMNNVKNGYIILCHDLYETTAAAVEQAIPDLVNQGYQLVTVSELLSFHKNGAVPGKVYNRVDPENIVTGK